MPAGVSQLCGAGLKKFFLESQRALTLTPCKTPKAIVFKDMCALPVLACLVDSQKAEHVMAFGPA